VFVVDREIGEFARNAPELLHEFAPAIAERRANLKNSLLFSVLPPPHRANRFIAAS